MLSSETLGFQFLSWQKDYVSGCLRVWNLSFQLSEASLRLKMGAAYIGSGIEKKIKMCTWVK